MVLFLILYVIIYIVIYVVKLFYYILEPIAKLKNYYTKNNKGSDKDCKIFYHLSKTKENRPHPAFRGDTLPMV
jgi:hypothetical protein